MASLKQAQPRRRGDADFSDIQKEVFPAKAERIWEVVSDSGSAPPDEINPRQFEGDKHWLAVFVEGQQTEWDAARQSKAHRHCAGEAELLLGAHSGLLLRRNQIVFIYFIKLLQFYLFVHF